MRLWMLNRDGVEVFRRKDGAIAAAIWRRLEGWYVVIYDRREHQYHTVAIKLLSPLKTARAWAHAKLEILETKESE